MESIKELDIAVLNRDLAEFGLRKGDIGAVVHVYNDRGAYEIEFTSAVGESIAVLTLEAADIRLIGKNDIMHARERGS